MHALQKQQQQQKTEEKKNNPIFIRELKSNNNSNDDVESRAHRIETVLENGFNSLMVLYHNESMNHSIRL